MLIFVQYGVEIDVPAATILSLFGLRAQVRFLFHLNHHLTENQSFWWPNMGLLGIMFGTFTIFSYLLLHFYVREQR